LYENAKKSRLKVGIKFRAGVIKLLVIVPLLFANLSLAAEQKESDPFQKNRGTAYEYKDNDTPDIWFFPVDKARWDGSKVTVKEWHMLTDFQQAMFVAEYIKELKNQYKTDIKYNVREYLLFLDSFITGYLSTNPDIQIRMIIEAVLAQQGKIKKTTL